VRRTRLLLGCVVVLAAGCSSATSTASQGVAASSTIRVLTAPIGQTKAGSTNRTPVEVRFTPSRKGRLVRLQRLQGARWVTVAKSRENRAGRVSFQPSIAATDTRKLRAVAASFHGASAKRTKAVVPSRWQVGFQDGFAGAALDETKWSYRELGKEPYGFRRCATSTKRTVRVSGGRLHLKVKKVSRPAGVSAKTCPHGFFENAQISTVSDGADSTTSTGPSPDYSFKYGIMAARLRFPHVAGQHGSLWSQPAEPQQTGNPKTDGAEIDAAEYFGDGRKDGGLSHLVHYRNASGKLVSLGGVVNADRLLAKGREWSDAFHVFSVEWTPSKYVFRVDGNITATISRGVSQTPQYVILSLLTSDWELSKMKPSKINAMDVDWVRVWNEPEPDGESTS
jgi:beta-glucanase (GH16 family)